METKLFSFQPEDKRRLSSLRSIEIKRTGLTKCLAQLQYGSPLYFEPTIRQAQGTVQPALSRKLNSLK